MTESLIISPLWGIPEEDKLFLKDIPKACTADDILGIRSQFLTQTGDIDIYRTVGHHYPSPYSVHQLLAREHLTTVCQ